MKIGEIFYYDETYKDKAEWCNENDCRIEEVGEDEKGRQFVIIENEKESEDDIVRQRRKIECFEIVNRGNVWYDGLTAEQKEDLKIWYQAWLDAPKTKIIPQQPLWIKC